MATAGYSGTPLPLKLGLKEGMRVLLVRPPQGAEGLLEPIPADVRLMRRAGGSLDMVLAFCHRRRDLARDLDRLLPSLVPAGMFWAAWPKRASGVATDITEDVVREVALPMGLVDTKVCAIDATWSGLRLVLRRELRSVGGSPHPA